MTIDFYMTTSEEISLDKALTLVFSGTAEPLSPSSMLHPQVYVTYTDGVFPAVNYAFIRDYGRYYFVGNPVWISGGVWQVQLDVDVLTSWKSGIRDLTAYVKRNQQRFNASITDTYTPSVVELTQERVHLTFDTSSGAGLIGWPRNGSILVQPGYCVIVALDVGAYKKEGSDTWYYPSTPYLYVACSFDSYAELTNYMKRIGADLLSGLTGVRDISGIIADAYVLPFTPTIGSKISKIGMWVTPNLSITSWDGIEEYALPSDCYVVNYTSLVEFYWRADVTLPYEENYLNTAPFTSYTVLQYPFGNIEVDGRILSAKGRKVRLFVGCRCDVLSGQCVYSYGTGDFGVDLTIGQLRDVCVYPLGETNVKVPFASIRVNSSNMSVAEMTSKATGLVVNASTAMGGGIASAALAGAQLGADLSETKMPSSVITGSPRGAIYTDGAYLIMTYQKQQPIPADLVGRPLCESVTLGDLTGFTIVGDVHVEGIPCLYEEQREIENALKAGVIL